MRQYRFLAVVCVALAILLLMATQSFAQFGFGYGNYRDGRAWGVSAGSPGYYSGSSYGYYPYRSYGGWYGDGYRASPYSSYSYYPSWNSSGWSYSPTWYGSTYYPSSSYTYAPAWSSYPMVAYGSNYASPTYPSSSTYGNQTNTMQSFYAPNMEGNRSAFIRTIVPPDAEVWFEGDKTMQTGPDRLFRSPPLEPGKNYTYDLKVRWMENGQPVEKTRQVRVTAGEESFVNLLAPESRDSDRDRKNQDLNLDKKDRDSDQNRKDVNQDRKDLDKKDQDK